MLDGLDKIDWGRLTHAYGPADDVPGQIRGLLSADREQRGQALWQLYGNIFHQGTRYEATAHAVPFLLELLSNPDTPDRIELIGLLSSIAIGYDETWLPDGLPIADLRASAAGEVEVAAYDAVRVGVPLFCHLVAGDDPRLATGAAYLLAWFPEDAETSLPALTVAAQRRSEPTLAATAHAAIGLLGGSPDPTALTDPDPRVRWGAAVALARTQGHDAEQVVAEKLLTWTRGEHPPDRQIPYLDGDLSGYAGLALRQLHPRHTEAAFDTLLTRLSQVSGIPALPVLQEALRIAFPQGQAPDDPTTLDERQRRLVRTLADSPEAWKIGDAVFGNVSLLIREYGLPGDLERMRQYAGT